MRGQCAGSQAGTELFQQTIQQESQRFEQDNRMLEFDSFFEYQRSFDGNQRTRHGTTRQFLQVEALLPKALTQCHDRQRSKGAEVANAPAGKSFEQAIGGLLFFIFEAVAE